MTHRFIRINAMTAAARHEMIPRLRDAVGESGGWIVDFQVFSDVSICIRFEIPARHVRRLRDALAATGVSLSEESLEALAAFPHPPPRGTSGEGAEVAGTLQVRFLYDEPGVRSPAEG